MRRRIFLLAPLSLGLLRPAVAKTVGPGPIAVEMPWAKPSVTEAAAVFMTLRNEGQRADRLVGGRTPVAELVILREFEGSALDYIDLQPDRAVKLKPGRRYIALRGLKQILAIDDRFPLTLRFAEAGTIEVTIRVAEGIEEE
jgi:periplasmic copper chaperone A